MKYYHITFRSVTFAQRGQSVLKKAGIASTLLRTPRWMEEQGCGYCLRLKVQDPAAAVALLQQQEIPLRKVYLQNGEGGLEQWRP